MLPKKHEDEQHAKRPRQENSQAESEREIRALQRRIRALQDGIAGQEELYEDMAARVAEEEDRNEDIEEENDDLTAENDHLTDQLAAAQALIDAQEAAIVLFHNQLAAERALTQQLRDQLATEQALTQQLQRDVTTERGRSALVHSAFTTAREDSRRLQRENATLRENEQDLLRELHAHGVRFGNTPPRPTRLAAPRTELTPSQGLPNAGHNIAPQEAALYNGAMAQPHVTHRAALPTHAIDFAGAQQMPRLPFADAASALPPQAFPTALSRHNVAAPREASYGRSIPNPQAQYAGLPVPGIHGRAPTSDAAPVVPSRARRSAIAAHDGNAGPRTFVGTNATAAPHMPPEAYRE